MPGKELPKLYLNENVPPRLVESLAAHGIASVHTVQVDNKGATDEYQLTYAADRGFIIVTHNRKHFRQLHSQWVAAGKLHSGILVMDPGEPAHLADRIRRFFREDYSALRAPFCVSPPK
jgi:hypothetical protein